MVRMHVSCYFGERQFQTAFKSPEKKETPKNTEYIFGKVGTYYGTMWCVESGFHGFFLVTILLCMTRQVQQLTQLISRICQLKWICIYLLNACA